MTAPGTTYTLKKTVVSLLSILALVLIAHPFLVFAAQDGSVKTTLIVEISGFRNSEGNARVCLFDSEKGFPPKSEQAFRTVTVGISDNRGKAMFRNLPAGVYAVSVLHDENANGRMDTNTLGLPREGVGASNDPQSILSPPAFEDSKFALSSDVLVLSIRIHYL